MEIKGNINAGYGNTIGSGETKTSILGGYSNTINTTGGNNSSHIIGGGNENKIYGYSYGGGNFIGGGGSAYQYAHGPSYVKGNIIDGGSGNVIVGGYYGNVISGGTYGSFIGGGHENIIGNSRSVIVGGKRNINNSERSFIGGGQDNTLTGVGSNIVGGQDNTMNGGNSSIVGGIDNFVVGNNNLIGGGSGNTVNTNFGVIVGGYGNQIPSGAAYKSSIVGGNNNQILNSNESFIGGGDSNELRQSSNNSFIGGGYNNIIGTIVTATDNAPVSVIVGGGGNYISSGGKGFETTHGFIGGGLNNYLLEGAFSFIGAGANNRITGNTSTIVGGSGNTIKGFRGFIGGGDTNIINSSADALIGNGQDNYIGAGANYSAIINGSNNYIKPIGSSGPFLQSHNLIGGGKDNRITSYSNVASSRGYNVILGSEKANIYGYSYKTHNTIIGTGWLWSTPISNYSSAIKGSNNTILGGVASYNDRYGNATTGITHGIIGFSYVSTLIGGYGNLISRGYYSTIGGGYHNYIDNGSSNFIGNGYHNTTRNTSYSIIGGGINNYIYNGGTVSILGGNNNYINGVQSTIVSGRDNILKTNYSTILGGYSNHSKHLGSQIIGSHVESISVNTTSVKSLNIQTIPMSNSMKTLGVDANGIVTDDNIVSLNEITGYTNQYYLRIAGSATTVGFASNTMSRDGLIVDSVQTSNGDIYLVGTFTAFGHYEYRNIVKLTENGIIDPSFTSYADTGQIQTVDVQSDGKILIGGDFTTYSGQSYFRIVRLNTDGTIDGTFTVGTGFNNRVTSIKVQPDGKILVGGFFTNYNGSSRNRIVRLNTDGTIDGTFSIGSGFNNSVNSVSLQSDGKILVGGSFINYNGTGSVRFARLNTNGTIDGTFTIGTGFNNQVYDSVELSDGKILVGGQFTACDDNTAQCIARLSSTGSFDATFSAATGFTITTGTAIVRSLIEDSDNKYLVGGQFTAYSGQVYNHIVRFETGGTIDSTFISVGEGFEKTTQSFGEPVLYTILELNNGTYLTSGYRMQKFVNPDINIRASHYNIDKNGNVLGITYSREEYKTSVTNVLSNINTDVTINGSLTVGESLSTSQLNTPNLTAGLYNDYDPGTETSFISLRTNFTATTEFTGLANGVSGKRMVFYGRDLGSQPVTFKHNDTGSTASNRFINGNTATDKVMNGDDTIEYIYDSNRQRWVYLGGSI